MTISMTWPQYLRRQCTFNGEVVNLSRTEAEIVSTLLMWRGRPVPKSTLISAVWPNPDLEPDWSENSIFVYAYRLRRKLPGVIESHRGHGFVIR